MNDNVAPLNLAATVFPAIQNLKAGSLKPTETVEKNTLPTKEDIEAAKKEEESPQQ